MGNKTYQGIETIIEKYRAAGYFKQAACAVFDRDGILYTCGAGGADENSVFDLASLTKIFTTTIILKLIDEGRIGLHEKIGTYLTVPSGGRAGFIDERTDNSDGHKHICGDVSACKVFPNVSAAFAQISVYQLLTHTGGLIAWYPFYAEKGSFYEILEKLIVLPLKQGTVVYSDLSFILLGHIVCAVTGLSLEAAVDTYVRAPLGLRTLMYCPGKGKKQNAAESSCDEKKKKIVVSSYDNKIEERMCAERGISFENFRPHGHSICGEANDGNCFYYFGGVSGHAGLFSDALSVARLGMFYLNAAAGAAAETGGRGSGQKVRNDADDCRERRSVFYVAQEAAQGTRGLGFDTGVLYPEGCGHTGFTGTSLYISADNNIGAVFLTNRLTGMVDGKAPDLTNFRREAAEAVLAAAATSPSREKTFAAAFSKTADASSNEMLQAALEGGFMRKGRFEDAGEIAEIYNAGLRAAYTDILPEDYLNNLTFDHACRLWQKNLAREDYTCIVWEENGHIAGFIGYKPDDERADCIMLAALYVSEKYKGKSIGTRLIGEVHKRARLAGDRYVAITVVLRNKRAKALYEHLGAVFEKECVYDFGGNIETCGRYLWTLPV